MTPLIRRGLIAAASERPADALHSSDIARAGARRRIIRFAALGIAAFLVALLWTMPASVIVRNVPWRTGVAGTVWNGEVGVAGGSILSWDWAPLRSLTSLGFAVDWRAAGANTDLGGQALVRPGRLVLDAMTGRADASLLRAIQPNLPFTCDMAMQVEFPRAIIGGAGQMVQGNLLTEAGSCAPKAGGTPTRVPPLALVAEKVGTESRLRLTPAAQRRRILMTIVLDESGEVAITMTPEGAAALPFVGMPPGASIRGAI